LRDYPFDRLFAKVQPGRWTFMFSSAHGMMICELDSPPFPSI